MVLSVLTAHLLISTVASVLNPAFSNPKANPPAPAKSSTTVYLELFIILILLMIFSLIIYILKTNNLASINFTGLSGLLTLTSKTSTASLSSLGKES